MNTQKLHKKPIVIATSILVLFWLYNYSGSTVFFSAGCAVLFGWFIFGNTDSVFLSLLLLVPNVMMIKHLSISVAILGYATLIFEWKYLMNVAITKHRLEAGLEVVLFLISTLFTFSLTLSSSYVLSAIRVISFSCFVAS